MECHTNYTVLIINSIKGSVSRKVMARSRWEAIDKAYTELQEFQPDRSKYIIKRPTLRLS